MRYDNGVEVILSPIGARYHLPKFHGIKGATACHQYLRPEGLVLGRIHAGPGVPFMLRNNTYSLWPCVRCFGFGRVGERVVGGSG